MTQIIRQTNKLKYHTDLREIIKPFRTEFASYNWLLTNQEYILLDFDKKNVVDKLDHDVDRIIFSGPELLEIVDNREIQFVWGVFCGFKNNIPDLDSKELPVADCNPQIWTDPDKFFLAQSEIEIICFDSSSTIIRFRDPSLEDKFAKYFSEATVLTKKNAC